MHFSQRRMAAVHRVLLHTDLLHAEVLLGQKHAVLWKLLIQSQINLGKQEDFDSCIPIFSG